MPLARRGPVYVSRTLSAALCVALALSFAGVAGAQRPKPKPRLAKPQQLDKELTWHRDPATGELTLVPPAVSASAARSSALAHRLTVRTLLVPITCVPLGASGDPLLNLGAADFRVYDDGLARPIVYFHAQSDLPAEVALVVDASPSVFPNSGEMKAAARALAASLDPADQIAVVDFSEHTYLQLPLTANRALLASAIERVSVTGLLGDTGGSNIYQSVYLAAEKLFTNSASRKAIVLLTDGQDSGLGLSLDPRRPSPQPSDAGGHLTFDDVIQSLAARDIQLFVVSTENRPKIMTPDWLFGHRNQSLIDRSLLREGIPAYTLFLAELVRRTGGSLYFLNEDPAMSATFRRVAERIRSEYWLGVSPAPAGPKDTTPHPGWHSLRVEVVGRGQTRVIHRPSYYVPASNP